MSINKLNLNNKDKYIEQAFEILNFFKSIIIEVHHIGSSRLEKFPIIATWIFCLSLNLTMTSGILQIF